MHERDLSELSAEIAYLRRPHHAPPLTDDDLADDPLEQFAAWLAEALAAGLALPNSMALATATAAGAPSVRMVLLKGVDHRGFVFYTSYDSRKARELAENPRAGLVFHWPRLERQVRASGPVSKVSPVEAEQYFSTRPRGSQLAAWASRQSEVLVDRAELERQVIEIEKRYGDVVPRPPNWGGYRLDPDEIEFWQGRADRLHDRFRYFEHAGAWKRERLYP